MEIKSFVKIVKKTYEYEGMYNRITKFPQYTGNVQKIEANGKYGLFDTFNEIVVTNQIFDILYLLIPGLWVGKYENNTYVINDEGKVILKTELDKIEITDLYGRNMINCYSQTSPRGWHKFYSLKGTYLGQECISFGFDDALVQNIIQTIDQESELYYGMSDVIVDAIPKRDIRSFDVYGKFEDGNYYLLDSFKKYEEYLYFLENIKNEKGYQLKLGQIKLDSKFQ